jgi:hypothetical protein
VFFYLYPWAGSDSNSTDDGYWNQNTTYEGSYNQTGSDGFLGGDYTEYNASNSSGWNDTYNNGSDWYGYNQTSNYENEYVYKEGVRFDKYDPWEGPYKKYKEYQQDYQTAAKKESDDEPLCKGRNQIVIVADNRVP